MFDNFGSKLGDLTCLITLLGLVACGDAKTTATTTNVETGTNDPGTADPGTNDPGTADPGTNDPGTADPGTNDPETVEPGTNNPAAPDPNDGGGTPYTGHMAWLYTKAGSNHIHVRDASNNEQVWMGRGVNIDDIFAGGANNTLGFTSGGKDQLLDVVTVLMDEWKPNLIRVNLSMSSYYPDFGPLTSWLGSPTQNAYKEAMIAVIEELGNRGAYVLVTVRADETMHTDGLPCIFTNTSYDDARCVPTAATDVVYQALVDSFWDKPYVMFGISNEGGGMSVEAAELRALMSHAVDVIRAREDERGGQHHLVAVQSMYWTSQVSYYNSSSTRLPQDNVVYEYHGYPPFYEESGTGFNDGYGIDSSTSAPFTIPILIGEYGPSDASGEDVSSLNGFYDKVEAGQIPNIAWMFDPFSAVFPYLVTGWDESDRNPSNLNLTNWGTLVKDYLLDHAP